MGELASVIGGVLGLVGWWCLLLSMPEASGVRKNF